ncbi:MAG: SPFH domain-containing protein [Opitutales bacterium]
MMKKSTFVLGGIGLVVVAILLVLAGSFYTVQTGEVGIEKLGGRIVEIAEPGFNFKLPFVSEVETFSTLETPLSLDNVSVYYSPRRTEEGAGSTDDSLPAVDDSSVQIAENNTSQETIHDFTVYYRVYPKDVERVRNNIGGQEFLPAYISPQANNVYKSVVANFDPLTIADNRARITTEVNKRLQAELDGTGITVTQVEFENFEFEEGVKASFEEANRARSLVQAEEFRRQQANIEAQRVEIEARGEANARIERARGEAEAIRQQGVALRENPQVLLLEAITQWGQNGGQVPETLMLLGGGAELGEGFSLGNLQAAPIQVAPQVVGGESTSQTESDE